MTQKKANTNKIGALWLKEYRNDDGSVKRVLDGSITLPSGEALGVKVYKNDFKKESKQPDFVVYKKKPKQQNKVGDFVQPPPESDIPF